MAETSNNSSTGLIKQEIAGKHVQEFAMKIEKIPERYIHKEGVYGAIDASCPMAEVPVIDFSLLLLTSPVSQGAAEEELKKLHSALTTWGCFQVINHGIESSFLDKVRDIAKQFYELPPEEKNKYSRAVDNIQGYGNDTVVSDRQTIDWTDRLYLSVDPEDKQQLQYWPHNPTNFRETLDEYTRKTRGIKENILKAMAMSLNLEENSFLRQLGINTEARFNFYPLCAWPDKILGIKPHADGSAITILLQDKQVAGLQIMKDDQWFGVPVIPHALCINAGDLLEIMSNGIFKSPMHRGLTNSEKERITVAMFCSPEKHNEIGPVEELINHESPRLYKNVPYNLDTFFQYYQQGLRVTGAFKL